MRRPIQQVEANLAALVESTSDLIWCVDLGFRLLSFNSAYRKNIENNYGVTPELGRTVLELLPAPDKSPWPEFYRRALDQGPFHLEYTLKDSRILDMSLNPVVVDGEQIGVSVFGKDITALKKVEVANQYLLAAAETMPDGLVTTTPEGIVLTWNKGAEQIFGYQAEEVIGQHYTMLAPGERAERLIGQYKEMQEKKTVFRTRGIGVRKDGSRVQVSVTKCPVLNAANEVIAFSTIVRDITRDCETEQARELLAAFVYSSEDAIMTLDRARRVTSWNPGAEKLLGYTAEEIVGQSVDLIIPDSKRGDASRNQQQVINGTPMEPLEKTTQHKDGRILQVEIRLAPVLGIDGETIGLSVNMRDIHRRMHLERLIRESEEYYRELFESLPVGLVVLQADGSISEVNQEACAILRMTREQVCSRGSFDPAWKAVREDGSLFPREELPALYTLATGEPQKAVIMGLGEAESRLWISMNSHPLFVEGKALPHAVVTSFIDVTEKVHDAAALRALSGQYQNLLASASEVAIIFTGLDGSIKLFNKGAEQLLGYRADEVVGQTTEQLLRRVTDRSVVGAREHGQSLDDGLPHRHSYQRKDGSVVHVQASTAPVIADDGEITGHLTVVQDITERIEVEQALRRVAQVDQLTGIPNRRHLNEQVEAEYERIRRHGGNSAVMMVDIDHFKAINDSHGHETGDLAIVAVATVLQQSIRGTDLVARFGGDEFVVLISGADEAEAILVAQKLCRTVAGMRLQARERVLPLTISIGVSKIEAEDSGWSEALRRADNALYLAKRGGRNRARLYRH